MGAISYDSYDMQTASVITGSVKHHSMGIKDIKKAVVANGNRSVYLGPNFVEKSITITGQLVAASISAMDTLEDTFKTHLVGKDRNLDIEHAGGTRRYTATPASVDVDRPGDLNWGNFTVIFDCASPFGISTSANTLDTVTAHTTATLTSAIDFEGSAEYQYPIFELTLNSGTQLTGQSITIGNGLNGQLLTITRDWAAADVLVIDTKESMVTVNGNEAAFTGALPIFENGTGSYTYEDTFLTRNVDIDVTQYRHWA